MIEKTIFAGFAVMGEEGYVVNSPMSPKMSPKMSPMMSPLMSPPMSQMMSQKMSPNDEPTDEPNDEPKDEPIFIYGFQIPETSLDCGCDAYCGTGDNNIFATERPANHQLPPGIRLSHGQFSQPEHFPRLDYQEKIEDCQSPRSQSQEESPRISPSDVVGVSRCVFFVLLRFHLRFLSKFSILVYWLV